MSNIYGITGNDGYQPTYQPEARWYPWGLPDIFNGGPGLNKFVPKVNDYVIDPETYTTYIVDRVDPTTLIAELRIIKPSGMTIALPQEDTLFGIVGDARPNNYRIYIDKTTTPYTISVDALLQIKHNLSSYARIFSKNDMGQVGDPISLVYNGSGDFVGHNVPLSLCAIDNHTNYTIKTVNSCKTNENLISGDTVYVCIYSPTGSLLSKTELIVEESTFTPGVTTAAKYVDHISLKSPFLSQAETNQIDFPLGLPLNSLNLMGTVHYNDGTTVDLPVNNTRFSMLGLEAAMANIEGSSNNLVLKYALGVGEYAVGNVTEDGLFVTEPYTMKVVNSNNSYSVKLFCYPEWIGPILGYRLKWWLFNMDRNVFFDVTDYVTFDPLYGAFEPTLYSYTQRKSVSILLSSVSGAFKPYVHTQVVDISLYGSPADYDTPWTVKHTVASNQPLYGLNLAAHRVTSTSLNISAGITDYNEWKQRVYYNTAPLINEGAEGSTPISPTHFLLDYNGTVVRFPISMWNQNMDIGVNITLLKSVRICFIKETSSGDLYLSMAEMSIKA